MVSHRETVERRFKVSQLLARSVSSGKEISKILGVNYNLIRKDIEEIRKQSLPWLSDLAKEGYAFDCKLAIEKLLNLERELEDMRDNAKQQHPDNTSKRIMIIKTLGEIVVSRLSIEGEGPTLIALRKSNSAEQITKDLAKHQT